MLPMADRLAILTEAFEAVSVLPLFPSNVHAPEFTQGVRLGREQAKDAIRVLIHAIQQSQPHLPDPSV